MGVLPWSKGNAQRKFVDLINEATFKWANWDPPKVIQVSPSPLHHHPSFRRTALVTDRRFWHYRQEDGRVESRGERLYTPADQAHRAGLSRVRGSRDRSVSDTLSTSEEAGYTSRRRRVSLQLDPSYVRLFSPQCSAAPPLLMTRVSLSKAGGNSTPSAARSC